MNNQYGQGNAFIKQETVTDGNAAIVVTPPAATSFEPYVLDTTLNGAAETSVVITVAPPTSLGTKGTIKIKKDNGTILSVAYTNRSGATFTIAATDFSSGEEATAGTLVMVGNENRIIVRGWSMSSAHSNASLQSAQLQTNNGGGAETIIKLNMAATSGATSDGSGAHVPIPAGESLQILNSTGTTIATDILIWGEYAPHGVPQCTGYVYGTP